MHFLVGYYLNFVYYMEHLFRAYSICQTQTETSLGFLVSSFHLPNLNWFGWNLANQFWDSVLQDGGV